MLLTVAVNCAGLFSVCLLPSVVLTDSRRILDEFLPARSGGSRSRSHLHAWDQGDETHDGCRL